MDQSAGVLGQSSKDDKTHILIYVLTQYIFYSRSTCRFSNF